MEKRTLIEGRGLVRAFGERSRRIQVLNGVSLTVDSGQVAALVGRSGSGKTSLLQLLGLLAVPDDGIVLIDGQDTSDLGPRERAELRGTALGFVFQAANLLPQHDALTNTMLPWRGRRSDGRRRALELLDELGLADRANHRPDQLSGGEQQRVALARALLNEPSVILADEPTGSLDVDTERALLDVLARLASRGTAVLIITHSETVAATADVRWRLADGEIVRQEAAEAQR